ncbi:ribosome small subunit-dependent GTPase A [Mycoplasma phocimorsus]|uniref:ribosome small subunit-dependent GTPase A n=1 Tax=Mycoplasma phocimorsus TaxID=3045839 RepID=UPI0024BF5123|nr:ribosome small subunit-dependent GTPase A [Mycoplasma phocimorsus]MDJ1646425.1 ribosome small subunit-dependent GTPase A [Mycoplasma phocimorsus]
MNKNKIYSINSGFYDVWNGEKLIRLRGAGKLRNKNITPLVGDYVKISEGFIEDVLPRYNELLRPKVANIDNAFIIYSLKQPEFSSFMVDKYLSMVEYNEINPIIIFTKADLANDNYWINQYQELGYKCFTIGKFNQETEQKIINENICKINELIKNKTCVFMGQSGVGKSTLINSITGMNLKIDEISKALNRGKHTTRIVEIYRFNNSEIIDTPGFSNLVVPLTQQELSRSFKMFKENKVFCKFRSCLHANVDKKYCKILQLVDERKIPIFRYENYLKILKECNALKEY